MVTREEDTILSAQETELRSPSPTTRPPVPWREPGSAGATVRRLAGMALVALAFLAAPVPSAVAQEPARPEPQPRELWQQFPLDPERANQEEPAGRRSAPPTSRSTGEEGGDRSTVKLAAIVVAIWLMVMLVMTGTLAYASRGDFALTLEDLRRRRRRLRRFRDVLHAARTDGRQFGVAIRARLRSLRGAATRLRRTAANLRTRTGSVDSESAAHGVAALTERIDAYFASGKGESPAGDEVERLKAKLDHAASTRSPADGEHEILKAKRGKPAGSVGVERADEVETLKAKLAGNAVGKTGSHR
jgi:hypothetical protein